MITENEIKKLVGNKIFSALFTKKDGTTRLMSCRLGVSKGVKGKGLKFNASKKGLLNVFDMNKKEYRFVNLRKCSQIKANGQVITA